MGQRREGRMRRSIFWALWLVALAAAGCTEDPSPPGHVTASPASSPGPEAVPELGATRISLPSQPATLLYDRGTLWVGGSRVLKLEDDRILDRFPSGVSRVKLA